MKKLIVVYISDESVGVENLPTDVEVEVRDYRKASLKFGVPFIADDSGAPYVEHIFGD